MKVLMVTPHLPPHQAANALLPHLLGQALTRRGHQATFLTFGDAGDAGGIHYVRRRSRRWRGTRIPQALEGAATWWKGRRLIHAADVVHVHSNTWMNQVAAGLAVRLGRPYVLTHYGTEIWHHDGKDEVFRRLNRGASHVTFYSQALMDRGRELGVPFRAGSVVYPPVADVFRPRPDPERCALRARHGVEKGSLLLNVKRLHPLADQATLLDALARLHRERPDARLVIVGSGECHGELEAQTRRLGLEGVVRFTGLLPNDEVAALQAAADLFVLSSVLEATPTVALEALASGTPVVSTDNPGGLELAALFGDDLRVVRRRDPEALAAAMGEFLAAPRRTAPATARTIEERFRLDGVAERYLSLYREAAGA